MPVFVAAFPFTVMTNCHHCSFTGLISNLNNLPHDIMLATFGQFTNGNKKPKKTNWAQKYEADRQKPTVCFKVDLSFNLTLKSQFVYADTYHWIGRVLWSHGVLQQNRQVHFIEYGHGLPLWNGYQGNIQYKTSRALSMNDGAVIA